MHAQASWMWQDEQAHRHASLVLSVTTAWHPGWLSAHSLVTPGESTDRWCTGGAWANLRHQRQGRISPKAKGGRALGSMPGAKMLLQLH